MLKYTTFGMGYVAQGGQVGVTKIIPLEVENKDKEK